VGSILKLKENGLSQHVFLFLNGTHCWMWTRCPRRLEATIERDLWLVIVSTYSFLIHSAEKIKVHITTTCLFAQRLSILNILNNLNLSNTMVFEVLLRIHFGITFCLAHKAAYKILLKLSKIHDQILH
jgi:hypothetical protein